MGFCLGSVGAAHAAAALGRALVLVEAAPGPVLLRPAHCVGEAIGLNWAAGAHGLGLALTNLALGLPLPVRPEEEHDIIAPARSLVLPAPTRLLHQGGWTAYVRHEQLSSASRPWSSLATVS